MCIAAFVGCGGGTTGTGDVPTTLKGSLMTPEGTALSDVIMTVLETGDSDTSDGYGQFTVTTNLSSESVTLLLRLDDTETTTVISGIPSDAEIVEVAITMDVSGDAISVVSVTVNPSPETPTTASPTPTPDSTGVNMPSGDDSPHPTPDGSDTPTPTPTRSPEKSLISGRVLFRDGKPISGAQVTHRESGKSDRTNGSGRFSIETVISGKTATLAVRYNDQRGSVTIGNLPSGPLEIDVVLKLSLSSNPSVDSPTPGDSFSVSVDSKKVTGR